MEIVPIPWIKLRRGGHDSSQKMVIHRSLCECIFRCSVIQLCLTLCDPMDCSMPGFPALHSLSEFTKTHIHWISDAIQSSHPLLFPSPPAFDLSQHQGLFQWVSSLHQRTKVLELWLQHQSFQWIFSQFSFRIDWFDLPAVQGTLKSLLQHHSSKTSIPHSFYISQLFMLMNEALMDT